MRCLRPASSTATKRQGWRCAPLGAVPAARDVRLDRAEVATAVEDHRHRLADRQAVSGLVAMHFEVRLLDPKVTIDVFEGLGRRFRHHVVEVAVKQPNSVPREVLGIIDLAALEGLLCQRH